MTEQPAEVQPQEQPVQPQGGMRFFVKMDDFPEAPTYQQPLSLFRFEETAETLIMERFDKKGRKWVDSPSLIAFTGVGGDESFEEVDEAEANRLIAMWTPGDEEAEDADAEPEPEAEEVEGEAEGEIEVEEPVPPDEREKLEYNFDFRPQKGDDHGDLMFEFLERLKSEEPDQAEETEPKKDKSEKTVKERLEEDEEEREPTVRGLLRRIFGV